MKLLALSLLLLSFWAHLFRQVKDLNTQSKLDERSFRLIRNGSKGKCGVLTNGCILGLVDLDDDEDYEDDDDDDDEYEEDDYNDDDGDSSDDSKSIP